MSKDGFTKKDRDLIISIATKVDQVDKRVTKLEKTQVPVPPETPEKPEDVNGMVKSPFATIQNGPDFVEIGFASTEDTREAVNSRSIMASSIYEALRDMCRTTGITSIKLEITL